MAKNALFKITSTSVPSSHIDRRSTKMNFFEGKRVRKLRDTFNEALEITLQPQTPEVRTLLSVYATTSRRTLRGKLERGKKLILRVASPRPLDARHPDPYPLVRAFS